MELITRNIIFDTQYFLHTRLDFDSAELKSVAKLSEEDKVSVFMTDITEREIRKKIAEQINTTYEKLSGSDLRFLKLIPPYKAFSDAYDKEKAVAFFIEKFEKFKSSCRVQIIRSKDVRAMKIYEDYCEHRPPFGDKFKKSEFPDAFAIASIEHWLKKFRQKAYVLSGDKDWETYIAQRPNADLIHLTELSKFTDFVLRAEEELTDLVKFADGLLAAHELIVRKEMFKQIKLTGFDSDADEEDDIDNVYPVDAEILETEIVSVDRDGAVYNLDVMVKAVIDYSYVNYEKSRWDPEERRYLMVETENAQLLVEFEINCTVEIAFEEGLAANFTLVSVDVPDLISLSPEDADAFDAEDWMMHLPVMIHGVQDGNITQDGSGLTEYPNLVEAKKSWPELDVDNGSKQFTKASGNKIDEPLQFETWKRLRDV